MKQKCACDALDFKIHAKMSREDFQKMKLKKMIAIFACLCLVVAQNLFAESRTITLGGKNGWPEFEAASGISRGMGKFGYECVELATNAHKVSVETDLLLDFEDFKNGKFSDASGNYSVEKNSLLSSAKSIMGKRAALSRDNGDGISLLGKNGTVFGTKNRSGSFSIEFWICPATSENGEVIFEWHSSRIVGDYVFYQKIESAFINNRVVWTFTNLFEGASPENGEVQLESYTMLIPDKWSRHEISYDEESGLLEYRIDGKVESLKFITESGREGSTIFQPIFGDVAPINICPSFVGLIDDFKISRRVTDSSNPKNLIYERFKIDGGSFRTKPIVATPASVLNSLSIMENVPPQTEIRYYVRAGENYFGWDDNFPEWKQVKNGEEISGVSGRYFQIAAELFPDGGGRKSPSVTEIKVNYSQTPLPAPPLKLRAQAKDGGVDLSWNFSVDENAGGYFVYYGNRPGEYLGTDADQGPSPIKVQNISQFNLTGLKNGAIYYFAVSTYSNLDEHINGGLSNEVYARPGRR